MNPYKVLDIEKTASKQEIIQATARALREKKYSAREIASAQKALMNTVSRDAHKFLHFIELKDLKERLYPNRPQVGNKKPCLEYHPVGEKEL